MNQAQRNFLIKKIEETAKVRIDALKRSVPEAPSLNNYLLHAVMSNNFEIKNTEQLKEMIRQFALKATNRDDWMGNSWGSATKDGIHFRAKDFFIVPDEYQKLYDDYKAAKDKANEEIYLTQIQADTLITRIQLASDKTLQSMVNEVDDMGNLSLIDTKLKALTA